MKTPIPLLFAAAGAFLGLLPHSARAADPVLSGKLFEQIDGTNILSALVFPGIGRSASPRAEGNEIGDSFGEFTDPRAAMLQLETLKRQHGFSGGRVFAGFSYDSDRDGARLHFSCGISRSESSGFDDIWNGHVELQNGGFMDFGQFKLASRAERVRSIARCLAQLPGMPKLKPTHPVIRKIYIDDASYGLAEKWLRSQDPAAVQGDRAQYRQAFACLVSHAAQEMPEAVGDTVVFRSVAENSVHHVPAPAWQREVLPRILRQDTVEEEVQFGLTFFSVLNQDAARKIWAQTDSEKVIGLWPTRVGGDGNIVEGKLRDRIELALGIQNLKWLASCRRSAGLFELPPSRLPEPLPPRCAGQ
jgi:hypothetical protein